MGPLPGQNPQLLSLCEAAPRVTASASGSAGAQRPEKRVTARSKAPQKKWTGLHLPRKRDLNTLKTLPDREFRAGLAEVIKYGIIYDTGLFERLEREMPKLLQRDSETLAQVIARCCEIKADVVRQDETETGLRAMKQDKHTGSTGNEPEKPPRRGSNLRHLGGSRATIRN